MDGERFDELAKALATSSSRRTALKVVAGAAFGGLFGFRSLGSAEARPTLSPLSPLLTGEHCSVNAAPPKHFRRSH
jgi:hypothetical protein